MKDSVAHLVKESLAQLKYDISIDNIALERPNRKNHGDYSSNIAIIISKQNRLNPADFAISLAKQIKSNDTGSLLKKIEVAGPGFINFFVSDNKTRSYLHNISKLKENYGKSDVYTNKSSLIEFVSANPTGPLHIGHGRWAVIGDVIASILSAVGYDVKREFYINDSGRQIDLLVESVIARKEGRGVPSDGYAGEYISQIPISLPDRQAGNVQCPIKEQVINHILNGQKKTLANLGVNFDNWFSEKSLHDSNKVQETIKILKDKNYTYEKDGALWFKSTEYGDDKDRVLIRENGETTYFAADIAYHYDKFSRNFDLMIDIWGTDHHGYVARLKAAMAAIGCPSDKLEIIIGQLVTLYRGSEQIRMSKRTGEMTTLSEVIDEIGADACRFFFLLNKADAHMDFDIELAKKHSADNPVYYVQYAYARICSIFREGNIGPTNDPGVKLDLLTDGSERELICKLIDYPDEVFDCAQFRSPHRLTAYSIEVSKLFHSFYHKCRVLSDNKDITEARIFLLNCTRIVLSNVLKLLGISAPERM